MTAELQSTPVVSAKPRRKRRWLRLLLWSGVALVVSWFLALAFATWELNDAVAALKARSEPTTYAEALVRNESKAPSDAADLIRKALKEHERLGHPGDLASMVRGVYLTPISNNAIASVKPFLDKGEPVVALLEQVVALPPGPFTGASDAAKLAQTERDRLIQDVRSLARLLYVDARASGAVGDGRRAFRRLKTLLLLSEQLKAESFHIPQLVRIAIIGLGTSTAAFALPLADFSAEELLEISDLAGRMARDLKMAPGLFNECALVASILLDPEAIKEELRSEMMSRNRSGIDRNQIYIFLEWRWRELISSPIGLPARRRSAAQTLRVPDDVLELVDRPAPWTNEEKKRFDQWSWSVDADRVGLRPDPINLASIAFQAGVRARRRLVLMQLAFRLRRFELLHGKLPEKLEDLCDAMMPSLPTTWFEGKPFVYTTKGRSFTLTADPSIVPGWQLTNTQQRESLGLLFEFDADAGKPATGDR